MIRPDKALAFMRTAGAPPLNAGAYRQALGAPPVFLGNGGAISVVALIQDALRIPVALMGLGLAGDVIRGLNERSPRPNIRCGIATSIRFPADMDVAPGTRGATTAPVQRARGKELVG